MIPVSAPPRVRARLLGAPDGPVRVVHRGTHAVYLDVGGWCVGVVDEHATQVPCALGTRTGDLTAIGAGPAYVEAGVLHLSGVPLVTGRLRDVGVPALRPVQTIHQPGPAAPLDADTVARLVGAGDGLTPRGDDVLCGWLALHRAAGVPTPSVDAAVRLRMQHTTLLSATLLDCALQGEVLPEFAAYVVSLGTPARAAAERDLLAVGHSTGAGLLEGARWAAAEIHASVTEPA
ncbi:MAG: hypothetical protein JWR85_375 [Marmoricola sp.]|nr:hypothetical protein [Marmoricola sp.]